jgi:hypothetical protein
MKTNLFALDSARRQADFATRPLVRLAARLPLSLVVAGAGLPPPRFAVLTRPDAPSGASNYGI